ncbi:MAG: hypothetical protein RBT74_06645 [Tenuifilaceae bacterium]|jgi:hypothetical protein|nr:hypothetical protein [Tenuifilaceae bacterium]
MKSKIIYNKKLLIILIAIAAFGLSMVGCTPVSHLSMASNLPAVKENEFIFENDTLAVEYRFDGYYKTAYIIIHNKQGNPLLVDWSKSSIVVNGEMFLYWDDDLEIRASIDDPHNFGDKTALYSTSYVYGSLQRSNPIGFISPFAYINAKPKSIRNSFNYSNIIMSTPIWGWPTYSEIGNDNSFNSDNIETSLVFRSYLTLSTTSDFSSPFYVDQQFWANDFKSKNVKNTSNRSRVSRVTAQSIVIMGVTYSIASVLLFGVLSHALMF